MESQRNAPPRAAADPRAAVEPEPAASVGPAGEPTVERPTPGVPSVRELTELRTRLDARHTETLERVGGLVRDQRSLTTTIAADIASLRRDGDTLQALEATATEASGILGALTRRLGRRSRMLERRTVAARLQEQYAEVHTTLRKASAFADELRLCSVELALEVDRLHADVEESLEAVVDVEARIEAVDSELAALEARADATDARRIDRLRFERADLETAATLHETKARLCAQEVEPARSLRETVHSLHQEMAHYVLHASGSIEGSGRRIQALGLAADAPVVVSELQAGLDQLDLAMSATEAYLEQAHDMLTRVLPELSEQIRAQGSQAALELEAGLTALEQVRRGQASEADLKAAALAEVELLGVELERPGGR